MIIHWVGIGEVKSAVEGAQLGAILGSCVSVVLWQPEQRFAVMNHILLPGRTRNHRGPTPDGRFADESWRMMQARLARQGICLKSCIAFVAGGGSVVDTLQNNIGAQNIARMREHLEAAVIPVNIADVGGTQHRSARFDPITGEFTVRRGQQAGQQVSAQASFAFGHQAA
jgi:chemotaxis protein CheD